MTVAIQVKSAVRWILRGDKYTSKQSLPKVKYSLEVEDPSVVTDLPKTYPVSGPGLSNKLYE